jgi:ParB/RepB/Spo0J family partition protein
MPAASAKGERRIMTPLFTKVSPQERFVRLEHILPYRDDDDKPPRSTLKQSFAQLGHDHSHVLLLEVGEATYKLFAGRRRVDAAKASKLETIRALVYPQGTEECYLSAIALASHLSRDRNPLDEARELKALLQPGTSLEDIAKTFGYPISKLRKLLQLTELPDHLGDAVREGRLTQEGAYDYLKLSAEGKAAIDERSRAGEKITKDVLKTQTLAKSQDTFTQALLGYDLTPPKPKDVFRQALHTALASGLSSQDIQSLVDEVVGKVKRQPKVKRQEVRHVSSV